MDTQIISQYISYLKKHKKSCATISRNLSSLRCFFKYLIMKKVITFNPTTGIKNEKSMSSLPEIMSSQDVDTLLSAPDITTVLGMRDKAMLELLYATGLRVSELLSITVFDINLDVGYVNIKKQFLQGTYSTAVSHGCRGVKALFELIKGQAYRGKKQL